MIPEGTIMDSGEPTHSHKECRDKPMNGKERQEIMRRQSDYSVVSMKPVKVGGEKGIAETQSAAKEITAGRRTGARVSTKLAAITKCARENPRYKLMSVGHFLNEDFLEESFRLLKRDAATGIDRVTVGEYEIGLKENLKDLARRMKAKRYRPQAVRRVFIPKQDGSKRGLGIPAVEAAKVQAGRIVTGPGEEMQHDTSPYTIEIGGRRVKRQCASLVLGYSRRLFIRFYEKFDRFHCKLFLTEAFVANSGVCRRCVIDTSHVVIACGTGGSAQVSSEMEAFEKRFGFRFMAHELGDADRSGKVERPFWYIERNFLVGRTFKDDADLNLQAQRWLDERANVAQLVRLPLYVPEVYQIHRREVDAYGYAHLHGMRYSAPAAALGHTVAVRESGAEVVLLNGAEEVARHRKLTGAEGRSQSTLPGHERRGRRPRAVLPEEQRLKDLGAGKIGDAVDLSTNSILILKSNPSARQTIFE